MKLYFKGTIKIVEDVSFEDENGDGAKFFANYIQGDNNQMLKIVSREDFSGIVDEEQTFEIELRKGNDFGTQFKAQLVGYEIVA